MGPTPASAAKREGALSPAGGRVNCWQCGVAHAPDLFCPHCHAIQPLPEDADYFQILGVPRRLVLDPAALQRRYYELHRLLHPDRYQTGPQAARVASLRNTAAVNRAYQTLRDPIDRGLYWLVLHGESLGSNNNRVPIELAELVFETQEKLEELRAARGGNGNAALATEIDSVRQTLAERRAELLKELHENFVRWGAADADVATLTKELKTLLSAMAYLGTLMRDVEQALES